MKRLLTLLVLLATLSFTKSHAQFDAGTGYLAAGLRYYIIQNGLSIGTGAEFSHHAPNINNLHIPLELGYTFYLNHYVAIEPQVFYKVSVNDFTGGSEVGMRLGLGYYF